MDKAEIHTAVLTNKERLDRIEQKVDRIIEILSDGYLRRYMTADDLAQVLQVTPKWVLERARLPKDDPAHIPSFRWLGGKRLYFRREDITSLFEPANS